MRRRHLLIAASLHAADYSPAIPPVMKLPGVFLLLLVGGMSYAVGCPICDSETGAAVRAGIFNGSFARTFLEVAAPFPVLALLLYVINRYLPD